MVEQAIFFALGCIITALCALMFMPLLWRRALRLTRERLRLQVPLSMHEILAERDQLRAEFAVERLRIEQAMEAVLASKAADMAAVGRESVAAVKLHDDLVAERTTFARQLAEIDRLNRETTEAEAEAGALRIALDQSFAGIERWRARAEAAAADRDGLGDEIDSQRTTIAGLKTRAMGLEMRLTDAERGEASRSKATEESLRAHLETAKEHATRHETSAIALRRECDDAKARIRTLETELDAMRDREKASSLGRSLLAGQGRRDDAPTDHVDEELRASLHDLGLAVAMMSRRNASPPAEPRPARTDVPSPAEAD